MAFSPEPFGTMRPSSLIPSLMFPRRRRSTSFYKHTGVSIAAHAGQAGVESAYVIILSLARPLVRAHGPARAPRAPPAGPALGLLLLPPALAMLVVEVLLRLLHALAHGAHLCRTARGRRERELAEVRRAPRMRRGPGLGDRERVHSAARPCGLEGVYGRLLLLLAGDRVGLEGRLGEVGERLGGGFFQVALFGELRRLRSTKYKS